MEFKGLTSASHMSLPEAGYGSEEGYVGSEISGAVSDVTTPGASRLQASQLQQRSTTMQRLQLAAGVGFLLLDFDGENVLLLEYNQYRITQARDEQVEVKQDQSMKGCSPKKVG